MTSATMMTPRTTRLAHQAGFTLLEGMFAALVLAIGLLALAGMQGISLTKNVDANELTLVTNLAADMMERIQFNRRNASVYNNIDTLVAGTQPATDVMGRGDYAQWQQRLNATKLPGIRGRVAVVNPFGPTTLNQSQVTIQVNWNAHSNTGAFTIGRNVTLMKVIAPE
jgi:type IV pilus assembly protein PilV